MTDQLPGQAPQPPAWGQSPSPQHQPTAPPPAGPSRPLHKRGWFLFLTGGLVGLVLGIGNSDTDPDRAGTAAAEPRPRDFELTVKTLSKQCFGSARCNLTYRIEVGYNAPPLDPSNTYGVVYEVRGGEDGPQISTLTVEGDQSSVDSEEIISTTSPSRKLTAVATSVDLRS